MSVDPILALLLAAAGASSVLYLLGLWAVRRHLRIPATDPGDPLPPVSIIKPVKGVEEAMDENLQSVLAQRYPGPIEVVFSATDPADPGLALARAVAARHPHVPVRFVVSDPGFGRNPKVANLAGAFAAATHDLVWHSDANVRVPPDYLRRIVAEMQASGASLLTSIVVGTGERSVGAALENVQLSAFIAPAMCTALHVGGVPCVVGKSMLLRRSELDALGGLGRVRDVLAEDFVLGRDYARAGRRVHVSAVPVVNVNERIPVRRFLERHARWLKLRVTVHLGGWLADLGGNPVALLALAWLYSGLAAPLGTVLALAVVLKAAGDLDHVRRMRGEPLSIRWWWVLPVRDLVLAALFFYSAVSRTVCWRGVWMRIGRGSRILEVRHAPLGPTRTDPVGAPAALRG
ncbi:MAG: glycosyltransferase [Myxococcota bacterium]|nr:glycosyltransferase [Myxococcota bacterium]MDW8362948.1 glycosyltransferase [Myxococcales bacterium]